MPSHSIYINSMSEDARAMGFVFLLLCYDSKS